MKSTWTTAKAVVANSAAPAAPKRRTDPWLSETERRREINARAQPRWIPRVRRWLSRGPE